MDDGRDETWPSEIGAEIRASTPAEPNAEARIMAAVRAEAGGTRAPAERPAEGGAARLPVRGRPGAQAGGGLWTWLVRPRMVPVSPLAAGISAVVIAAALFAARDPGRSDAPGAGRRTGAGSRSPDALEHGGPGDARPVQFVIVSPGATRISVVGDFNNWDPARTPLAESAPGGVWSVTVPIPPGVYSYAFMVDGRLRPAADEPNAPRDEFGGANSVIVVGKDFM
jgi:hypothetical protein